MDRPFTPLEKAFMLALLRRANAYTGEYTPLYNKLVAIPPHEAAERFYTNYNWELVRHRQVQRLIAEGYICPVYDNWFEILRVPFQIHE